MIVINETLKQNMADAFKHLSKENSNIENIIEFIDFTHNTRYSEVEIVKCIVRFSNYSIDIDYSNH